MVKIVPYRDLKSKDELLPLMDHAFRWPLTEISTEEQTRLDARLKSSQIGFCAIENDHIVGHVGVLNLTTRTLNGSIENLGGIYGVATLPSQTRKGISTALMNSVHEHFIEKGYRFSILGTSIGLVAHAFYEKLGYRDFLQIPTAYKLLKRRKVRTAKETKFDYDRILAIYNKYMRNKVGLVVRDKAYFRMLKRFGEFSAQEHLIFEDGYALFKKQRDGPWTKGIWIRELISLNDKSMDELVSQIEMGAQDFIYDRSVMDDALLRVYKRRGYMIQEKSHSVFMIKPLLPDAFVKETYGTKFCMSGLDAI